MERRTKIICNKIRCKICGEILESKHVHDFRPCKCFKESKGTKGCAADGGTEYLRRVGNPDDYEELSITRLYTDEERDEFNRHQELLAEQYDGWIAFDYMD